MTVTVSVVLIFGAIVVALLRFKALGFGAFLLTTLFGFYLASTDAAPSINQVVASVGEAVAGLGN